MDEFVDSSGLPKHEIRGRDEEGLSSSQCQVCLIEEFCLLPFDNGTTEAF